MKIIICNNSSIPVYEQIKNEIIDQIMNGELTEGMILPSIRHLAMDIKISIMTIKKAYDELEKEGYIISVQGKGTFVTTKNVELVKEQAKKEIEKHVLKTVEISKQFQIEKQQILDLFDFLYEEWRKWKM